MSLIATYKITAFGMFAPNGFQAVKPGALVKLVFDSYFGRIQYAHIVVIPKMIDERQVAGTLAPPTSDRLRSMSPTVPSAELTIV